MTWEEFKSLSATEQQAFIDDLGKTIPVNGTALARHFGVNVSTVSRFLNAHGLVANSRPKQAVNVTPELIQIASRAIQDHTSPDGSLTPCDTLKQLFMRNNTSGYSVRAIREIFRTLSGTELQLQKDLCRFETADLEKLFLDRFGLSVRNNHHALLVVKLYAEFCEALGVQISDAIDGFTIDMSDKIRKLMVASPLHLSMKLQQAYGHINSGSMDCLYCCVAWLAFAGVDRGALPTIANDNVDLKSMCVTINDHRYPLYKEATQVFDYALHSKSFIVSNSRGAFVKDRVQDERLLRGIKNSSINVESMLRNMNDKARRRGVSLVYTPLRQSGAFYRVFELERIGFEPDFTPIITDGICQGGVHVDDHRIRQDYESWKQAFS